MLCFVICLTGRVDRSRFSVFFTVVIAVVVVDAGFRVCGCAVTISRTVIPVHILFFLFLQLTELVFVISLFITVVGYWFGLF